MRLGLFGGTFDPIHLGHLILAETCREAYALDQVWFVVAGAPPHKRGGRTDVKHRLEMVRLAIAGHSAFDVSEIEANRPGPHYSVDTLTQIHQERPADELFFLIGGDSLVDLPQWREPAQICRLAHVVVVNRPGAEPPPIAEVTATLQGDGPELLPMLDVRVPPIGIASSDLRRRLAEKQSIRYQVPRAVEVYIQEHRLYQPS